MRTFFLRLLREDDAVTAVEYAVMLALILVATIASIGVVAEQTGGMWGRVQSEIEAHGIGSTSS